MTVVYLTDDFPSVTFAFVSGDRCELFVESVCDGFMLRACLVFEGDGLVCWRIGTLF